MNNSVFSIVYSDFDIKEYFFLQTDQDVTMDQFRALCNELLPQAGYKAFLRQQSSEHGSWILWRSVVESLISLLEKQGYQRVSFDHFEVDGGFIVADNSISSELCEKLGFANFLIMDYNAKLEKKLEKERQAKKFLMSKKKAIQIIK